MASKMYRRLTWPVFDEGGNQVHAPGDLIAEDAPLDPAARFELVEVDEPDPPAPEEPPAPPEPPPAIPSDAAPRHATVKPEPAAGKGAAHK